MQRQELQDEYGFLSLDSKGRFVFIDKYKPNLSGIKLIGVWIYGSFPKAKNKQ